MTEGFYIYRPAGWGFGDKPSDGLGGPPVKDPLALYAVIGEKVIGQDSLERIIDDDIEGVQGGWDGIIGDQYQDDLLALRDGLRRLADKIDAALSVGR